MRSCVAFILIGVVFTALPSLAHGVDFELNRGQWGAGAEYVARLRSGPVLLTSIGLHLRGGAGFDFSGARSDGHWETGEPNGNLTSYYLGRDPRGYIEEVPHYSQLIRRGLYPGVDLMWRPNGNTVEFDLVIAPYADPAQVRLQFRNSLPVRLLHSGDLQWGHMLLKRPRILQSTSAGAPREIDGRWAVRGRDRVELRIGRYDRSLPLTIDPVLEASTYWGGSGEDTITFTDGSTIVGTTTSGDLPGLGSTVAPGRHIFISMPLNGKQWTWIYGGSGDEQVTSVSIGSSRGGGRLIAPILIGGYTTSRDLPVPGLNSRTWTPWQKYYAGGETDGFVLLFTSFLTAGAGGLRSYLTYAGTPGDDRVTAVDMDTLWNVAIAGTTNGRGLPQAPYTAGEEPSTFGGLDLFFMTGAAGNSDAQIPDANSFTVSSTRYWGGSGDDAPYALTRAIRGTNTYYLAGETSSPDIAVGKGVTGQLNGPTDAFLLAATVNGGFGAALLLGGSGWDRAQAAVATTDEILVAGSTSSADFPQLSPLQTAYGGGNSDAFLARADFALTGLATATTIGGSGDEAATVIATNASNIFVGGWTSSTNFPAINPLQPAYGGGPDDGFLLHLVNRDLVHATWFGGSGSDRITSIGRTLGPPSTAIVAGQTTSPDLPLAGAQQTSLQGIMDGFIAQIGNAIITAPVRTFAPKDGRTLISFGAAPAAGASFTVTSQNPAVVVLSTEDAPGAQVTIRNGARFLLADCLTDSGGSDITISSDGYVPRVIRVDCVPQLVTVSAKTIPSYVAPYLPSVFIDMVLAAADPASASGVVLPFSLRPGAASIPVRITSSNPDLGLMAELCEISPSLADCAVFLKPQVGGAIELSFSASVPVLPPTISLNLAAPRPTPSPLITAVPRGFQARMFISSANVTVSSQATFSSSNSSMIVISDNAARAGESSVTGSILGAFYAQGINIGEGTLLFSVAGQPDLVAPIKVAAPVAVLRPPSPFVRPLRLAPDDSLRLTASVQPGESAYGSYSANPGTSVKLSATSSDPEVLSVTAAAELTPSTSGVNFEVIAHKEGRATVTLQAPDGIAVSASEGRLEFVVGVK